MIGVENKAPSDEGSSAALSAEASDLQEHALQTLAALSQATRLEAFRILARCGEHGMGAGSLAKALGTPHNTLSTHLAILTRAGLIRSERVGRNVTYFIVPSSLGSTIGFLLQDCCEAMPELCFPDDLIAPEHSPTARVGEMSNANDQD